MQLYRIGDKLVDREKIFRMVEKVLDLRAEGLPQQEVATKLGLERTFVSRLENLGEIRKGKKIALIGFPLANKEEVEKLALESGIEFTLVMREGERWDFIQGRDGLGLFNTIMEIISNLKDFSNVIFVGSDMRIRLLETILPGKVIGIDIGKSPIKKDVYVEIERVKQIIDSLINNDEA